MKVAEAISDTNIGGAGRLLLSRLACAKGKRSGTIVILPRGSLLADRFAELGVGIWEVDGCRDRSLDARVLPEYIAAIKEIKPDIINSHGCLTARIAAKICRVPVKIHTRHCAFDIPLYKRVFPVKQIFGAANMFLSDKIIAVAGAAAENLKDTGVWEKKICVIINGSLPLRKYSATEKSLVRKSLGIPQESVVISMFARLEKCKGHIYLLAAAKLLLTISDKYRFLIVGSGNYEKKLKETAVNLGISDRVIFTGFAEDVTPYMNITDINVNCSTGTETSSLALSEGMSLGIPAVVSDFGGNPHMVKDGKNGFVFKMRDYKKLASLISKLAGDKKLYEKMSEKAFHRFASELNAEKFAKETDRLYQALYEQHIETKKSKSQTTKQRKKAPALR